MSRRHGTFDLFMLDFPPCVVVRVIYLDAMVLAMNYSEGG